MKKDKDIMSSDLEKRLNEFLGIIDTPCAINDICEEMDITPIEALSLKRIANEKGYLVVYAKNEDDEELLYNQGEIKSSIGEEPRFATDENKDFKFMVISNTLLGNTAQQLTILRDVYKQASELGIKHVFVCGNLAAKDYSVKSQYYTSNFIADKDSRIDYIIKNWPKDDNIKTYFVTSKFEDKGKTSLGNRISAQRDDMIFLGRGVGNIKVDDLLLRIISSDLDQTYTISYRAEQYAKSFRSEDKPDILLLGGTNHCDNLQYRDINIFTVPSLAGTTKEMTEKRKENVVGAYIVDVNTNTRKINSKFTAESILMPYYKTDKEDYIKANAKSADKSIITGDELKNEYSLKQVTRFYNMIKNGTKVEEYLAEKHMTFDELRGWIELSKGYGKLIEIVEDNNRDLVFRKILPKNIKLNHPSLKSDDIVENQFLLVSDTHLGNIHQQLHLLNKLYQEAYERGITTVFHLGDIVDGNYKMRTPFPAQNFLQGFDEQGKYVIKMYPKVDGMKTIAITGNHDKTHYVNGGATLNAWIPMLREDIEIIGQDQAFLNIDKVKYELRHPDDGSAASLSYKAQQMIEKMSSGQKPNIFMTGHYHKWYNMFYRNVFAFVLPCLCTQTNFELTHGLKPILGGVFLTVYSNKKTGQIEYIDVDERIFNEKDFWEEAGKDKKKVKQLTI